MNRNDLCLAEGEGTVYTLLELDYEKQSFYNMTVTVTDFGQPALTSTTYLLVTVNNLPDEVPKFSNRIYEVQVLDDTPVGTAFYTLSAGSGQYYYNISGKNDNKTTLWYWYDFMTKFILYFSIKF
jgi:hypothetical protein